MRERYDVESIKMATVRARTNTLQHAAADFRRVWYGLMHDTCTKSVKSRLDMYSRGIEDGIPRHIQLFGA